MNVVNARPASAVSNRSNASSTVLISECSSERIQRSSSGRSCGAGASANCSWLHPSPAPAYKVKKDAEL